MFVNFVDSWPVLFDDLDNPLHGRVTFLDFSTSQAKEVYENETYATLLENPQYTQIDGRLQHQVFLGTGDYKVKFEKYIGSGDMMDPVNAADVSLWVAYKTEAMSGLPTEDSSEMVNVATVNTIADLRLVDPEAFKTVRVLGYYNRNDNITSRIYIWSELDTRTDNFGTLIQHTGLNTGRWIMQEPEEMDSRYFGIFPSTTETYNSQLTALIAWNSSSYATCKSVRFSTGTYRFIAGTFTFISKVIMEKDVKFSISGAGDLTLNINADYDIQSMEPLVLNASALANVKISFNAGKSAINNIVKSCWYGNWANSTAGDSESLISMSSRVGKNYVIQINSQYYATSGTSTFIQDIEFYNGQIHGRGGNVVFSGNKLTSPMSTATRLLVGTGGSWEDFTFTDSTVSSSLFGSGGFQNVLTGLQANSTLSTFILDSNIVFTDAFTDNGAFKYVHIKGYINSSSPEVFATFETFETSDSGQKFSGNDVWVAIKNQPIKATWFMPTAPTQFQEECAIKNGFRCACMGSGLLDLCGLTYEVKNGFQILSTDGQRIIKMYNGQIEATNAGGIAYIMFRANASQLIFEDIFFYNSTEHYAEFLRLEGSQIQNVFFTRFVSFIAPTSKLITTYNGGSATWFSYANGYHKGGHLLDNPNFGQVNLSDNYYINGFVSMGNSKPIIDGNYFESCLNVIIKCNYSALVTGNRFFETDLSIYDNEALIDATVTGNQFESTDTKYSRVRFMGATANTVIKGALVTGNSFTGPVTSTFTAITAEGSFSNAWVYTDEVSEFSTLRHAYSSIHMFTVRDNSSSSHLIKTPATEGVFYTRSDGLNGSYVEHIENSFWRINKRLPIEVFHVPGSTYALQTSPVPVVQVGNGSYRYDINVLNQGGAFGDYRSDGFFCWFIKDNIYPNGGPAICNMNFKIYNTQEGLWIA